MRRIRKTANDARRRAVINKRKRRITERREKWFRIVQKDGKPKCQ
ncbi:hypothetical protein [Idiomarina seosinensis]